MPDPTNSLYLEQASQLLGMPIAAEYQASVEANFSRIASIAKLVLDFPLPDPIEVAPVFQP